jgi:hypothetical protein
MFERRGAYPTRERKRTAKRKLHGKAKERGAKTKEEKKKKKRGG